MKRLKDLLLEVFDKPYPIERVDGETFKFKTDSNLEYQIEFYKDKGSGKNAEWVISFFLLQGDMPGFSTGYKTGILKTGDSQRVMATVLSVARKFIKVRKPASLSFGADKAEPSRVRLYQTMLSRFAPPGYEPVVKPLIKNVYFTLKRSGLNEVFDAPYEVYHVKRGNAGDQWGFTTKDGIDYLVTFAIMDSVKEKWEVWFTAKTPGGWTTSKLKRDDSIRVMGTIVGLIRDFIKREKPMELGFVATKEDVSRVGLYDKLVKTIRIPGYRTVRKPGGGMINWALKREK